VPLNPVWSWLRLRIGLGVRECRIKLVAYKITEDRPLVADMGTVMLS
jgi:hypothetical protein